MADIDLKGRITAYYSSQSIMGCGTLSPSDWDLLVDLKKIHITDSQMIEIMDNLGGVKQLDISHARGFGDLGFESLIKLIGKNQIVTLICVGLEGISKSKFLEFLESVANNRSLRNLNLTYSSHTAGDSMLSKIAEIEIARPELAISTSSQRKWHQSFDSSLRFAKELGCSIE